MSKYTIYSTREDWEKLYRAVEKAGLDIKPFKVSQSYDSACVLYAEATGDYSLKKIGGKTKMEWTVLEQADDGDVFVTHVEAKNIEEAYDNYQTMESGNFIVLSSEVWNNLRGKK